MWQKQTQFRVILCSLLFSLSGLLNACGNSQQLQQLLGADPNLKSNSEKTAIDESSTRDENSRSDNNDKKQPNIRLTKLPKGESASAEESTAATSEVANLPESFPLYPPATLKVIAPQSTKEKGVSEWQAPDDVETIIAYYREKWQDSELQIVQPFELDVEDNPTAIVSIDNFDYTIVLTPVREADNSSDETQDSTQLTILYQAADLPPDSVPDDEVEEDADASVTGETQNNIDNITEEEPESSEPEGENNSQTKSQDSFADVSETPEQLQPYVEDLIALGVVSLKAEDIVADSSQFNPNEPITRREYARWLVNANNKYYGDSPGNKIRLANKSSSAAFKDISTSDRDFAEIQGLAEAGLIPSPLTNDSSNLLFQPDAPLTREDLIAWKVPLDIRGALPKATIQTVQESWGFQDASKIDPAAAPALFADYQNSDRSNVKRIFGYTTLFQPKKAVTRAEAAASVWSFGYQGDGITAKEVLDLD